MALHSSALKTLTLCAGCAALLACAPPSKPGAMAPSKAEPIAHESELLRLTLTPEAERRLDLQTVAVDNGSSRGVRTAHGEIIAAPQTGGLPVAASADLNAVAVNQARADGDVARARAELEVAEKAFVRAEELVREEAGSVRARDEAASALGVARANLDAARSQRTLLGPAITSMGDQGRLWVRVAAFASDLPGLDRSASASIRALGDDAAEISVSPAKGPPSANSGAGTVDLFYALPGAAKVQIGQRVAVSLPVRGEVRGVRTPSSAILRDIYGGEWVYVRVAPHAYQRQRIEIEGLSAGQALVTRGLEPGSEVVTAGAAELFGTEFGAK